MMTAYKITDMSIAAANTAVELLQKRMLQQEIIVDERDWDVLAEDLATVIHDNLPHLIGGCK